MSRVVAVLMMIAVTAAACSSGSAGDQIASDVSGSDVSSSEGVEPDGLSTFEVEVWADNWMAVYVDAELIGEDSVPITTERSFNAETFTFEASYPFVVGIEAKDFKETDSGLEYIGTPRQQMGDGGLIAQITDTATGAVVAVTNADWSALVVQRAPLNTDCEKDADPDATCEFEMIETPAGWSGLDYDAGSWASATEWTADQVGPKDGYDEINWNSAARLIWGTDLKVDNTVLVRAEVSR
jgi:hypothetical protein